MSDLSLSPDDSRLEVFGLADLVEQGGWWVPARLPVAVAPLLYPDLALRQSMPAGARIGFRTDATRLELDVHVEGLAGSDWPVAPFDVLVDGVLVRRDRILGRGTLAVTLERAAAEPAAAEPAATEHLVEIWLPNYGYPRLGELRLCGAAGVRRPALPSLRWMHYGSSISQCRESIGPSETWPALVAREGSLDLRCLGFGGQCHLDSEVARFMRDTPAEVITLCLGINVYGASSYSGRVLFGAVTGFVQTIRDGHPRAPIVVMSPIVSPERETVANAVGLTLEDVRGTVHDAVAVLRARGDSALEIIDGRELLREPDLLVDGLHPGDAGYRLMAERVVPRIRAALAAGGRS